MGYLAQASSATVAWFRCLEAMLFNGGLLSATEAAGGEASAKLEQGTAPLLEHAARGLLEGALRTLFADMDNVNLLDAGCRFLAALIADGAPPQLKALLLELRAVDVLAEIVLRHRTDERVQDQAVWALFKLAGHNPLVKLLHDPALGGQLAVTRAALWGLSHVRAAEQLTCSEREALAGVAEQALANFPRQPRLAVHALGVLGTMLDARLPDASHARATAALASVDAALLADRESQPLKAAAVRALVALVEGNGQAVRLLREQWSGVSALLDDVLQTHPSKDVQVSAARVLNAVFGVEGLLEALAKEPQPSENQQVALMRQIGWHSEESGADTLLRSDAIGHVRRALSGSPEAAAVGIAALGRIAEFLIEHATSSPQPTDSQETSSAQALEGHIVACVDAIVLRLDHETKQGKPNDTIYASALYALRNVSLRSDRLASHIAACASLTAAVEQAFERDYFHLGHEPLRQLLAAMLFFSGLQALITKLEKYPDASGFQEAALRVLVEAAEYQEGSDEEGSVLRAAVPLAFFANKVLLEKVPATPRRQRAGLACAAIQLQSHVLAPLDDLQGYYGNTHDLRTLTEEGIRSMLETLKQLPFQPRIAAEVCAAVAAVAVANSRANPVLVACSAGDVLLDVIRRFSESGEVLRAAALALGALGGFQQVLDFITYAPENVLVQKAGCRALGELCRRHFRLASEQERIQVQSALHQVQCVFAGPEHQQLQAQVELTLGLVSQVPVS